MTRRDAIRRFLNFEIHQDYVDYQIVDEHQEEDYRRHLIEYRGSEDDIIRAFLFLPKNEVVGSVLVHHQHHGNRALGKSEVAGLEGDPYQAFCPALAKRGFISLAPDSICFEDRMTSEARPTRDPDDEWLQHYNEMAYRLLRGTTLMKKIVDDSSIGISLLSQLENHDNNNIGLLGHSYGGNTVIFHAPFDDRVRFACTSGAACSYRTKFKNQTGIEMAEVIPGFSEKYDIQDLLRLISPRNLLMVAGTADKYAQDILPLFQSTLEVYKSQGAKDALKCQVFEGGHDLDSDRFHFILDWFAQQAG